MKTSKQITTERISRVIIAVLNSPNKSAKRAILWMKLIDLRSKVN